MMQNEYIVFVYHLLATYDEIELLYIMCELSIAYILPRQHSHAIDILTYIVNSVYLCK